MLLRALSVALLLALGAYQFHKHILQTTNSHKLHNFVPKRPSNLKQVIIDL